MHIRKENLFHAIVPILLSILAFYLVTGAKIIYPTNIAWLANGDPATHYLGWAFFRHAEWQFPLGLNPNYGLEIASSIIFSDSNPLFAIIFKLLSPLLPNNFQYFGIWILICFILQAFFSWKLLSLLTENRTILMTGTCILVFAPPMIWRCSGHLSLVGHFFILAGLYFSFNPTVIKRKLSWSTLLAITALVHAYLLAMVTLIWLADLCTKIIKTKLPIKHVAIEAITVLFFTLFACWQAGYFSVLDGASSDGYGFYRMNVLSMIDSSGWSYILKDFPEGKGDYEGFNYLGLGVIFLIICSIPIVLSGRVNLMNLIKKYPFFFFMAVFLTIFAISNNIGIGLCEIKYPLPKSVLSLANIFRGSGRFFWPVFYLIILCIIYVITRGYEKRIAAWLLAIAMILQIVDTHAGWHNIRKQLKTKSDVAWNAPLSDPFWAMAAAHYKKIRYVPPDNHSAGWPMLAIYANIHGLATDAIYLARISRSALDSAKNKAIFALRTGIYDRDSLYVLDERIVPLAAANLHKETDVLAKIDNLFVIAPGWKTCKSCEPIKNEIDISDLFSKIPYGKRIVTNLSGNGRSYLAYGWSFPESWGTWSDGSEAAIIIPLSTQKPKTIVFEIQPLLYPSHPKQDFDIMINKVPVAEIRLTSTSRKTFKIKIPDAIFTKKLSPNILIIDLKFHNAIRPKDIGINNDERKLALGMIAFTIY